MNKFPEKLLNLILNLCLFIALGIHGTGVSLLFFGEPDYPDIEPTHKRGYD